MRCIRQNYTSVYRFDCDVVAYQDIAAMLVHSYSFLLNTATAHHFRAFSLLFLTIRFTLNSRRSVK